MHQSKVNYNLFKKYNIKIIPNPDEIIRKDLSEDQKLNLFEQEYFKSGKYKILWEKFLLKWDQGMI